MLLLCNLCKVPDFSLRKCDFFFFQLSCWAKGDCSGIISTPLAEVML